MGWVNRNFKQDDIIMITSLGLMWHRPIGGGCVRHVRNMVRTAGTSTSAWGRLRTPIAPIF